MTTPLYLDRDASLSYFQERGISMSPHTWYRKIGSKADPIRTVRINGKRLSTAEWLDDYIEREIERSAAA